MKQDRTNNKNTDLQNVGCNKYQNQPKHVQMKEHIQQWSNEIQTTRRDYWMDTRQWLCEAVLKNKQTRLIVEAQHTVINVTEKLWNNELTTQTTIKSLYTKGYEAFCSRLDIIAYLDVVGLFGFFSDWISGSVCNKDCNLESFFLVWWDKGAGCTDL